MKRFDADPRPRRGARGFSIVEMVMSLLVLGIITTAAGGLIVLSARVWPKRAIDTGAGALGEALGQMAEDLAQATAVPGVGGNWVLFTIPDRDGDSKPESVLYQWSGKAGDPLHRHMARYEPTALTGPLDAFQLTVATRQETPTGSGGLVASASGSIFDATAGGSGEVAVTATSAYGYVITPSLPTGTVSWSIDRVRLRVRSSFSANDQFRVRVVAASAAGLPSGAILADVVVQESALSTSMGWYDVPVWVSGMPAGSSVAVCLTHAGGAGESCRISADLLGPAPADGQVVRSTTGGSTWAALPNAAITMRIFGTTSAFAIPGAPVTRIAQIRVSAKGSGAAGRTVTQSAILRNRPAHP